jgi:hypothetical protein
MFRITPGVLLLSSRGFCSPVRSFSEGGLARRSLGEGGSFNERGFFISVNREPSTVNYSLILDT